MPPRFCSRCHYQFVLTFTLHLTVSSADNFCKQFGLRSGLTICRAWSESKLFDTLKVFLYKFFENIIFEKIQQTPKLIFEKLHRKYLLLSLIFIENQENIATYGNSVMTYMDLDNKYLTESHMKNILPVYQKCSSFNIFCITTG